MPQLQPYSKIVVGEWRLTLPIVCNDGQIRTVVIEEYTDGLHAFLKVGNERYTNHTGYPTSRKAINAAASWDISNL